MTAAERQARRREQFRQMQDALRRIRDDARTIGEARRIAEEAFKALDTPGQVV
jgi:uncharacterized protein (UPF0147 family)